MKVIPIALLLVASLALVLVGCNDNSDSLLTPSQQAGVRGSLAKGSAVTTNEVVPYDMTFLIPCAGEDVRVTGEVHLVTHEVWDGNGGYLFTVHGNPSGLTGIGLTSGATYKAVGESHVEDHIKAGENYSWVSNILLISNGSAPNLVMTDFMHLKVNENGDITLSVDRHSIDCR